MNDAEERYNKKLAALNKEFSKSAQEFAALWAKQQADMQRALCEIQQRKRSPKSIIVHSPTGRMHDMGARLKEQKPVIIHTDDIVGTVENIEQDKWGFVGEEVYKKLLEYSKQDSFKQFIEQKTALYPPQDYQINLLKMLEEDEDIPENTKFSKRPPHQRIKRGRKERHY